MIERLRMRKMSCFRSELKPVSRVNCCSLASDPKALEGTGVGATSTCMLPPLDLRKTQPTVHACAQVTVGIVDLGVNFKGNAGRIERRRDV